jgi:hypothetical protein
MAVEPLPPDLAPGRSVNRVDIGSFIPEVDRKPTSSKLPELKPMFALAHQP